ncbi:SAM-dependent methyltransferase [Nocardioides sp. SYSU DS0651]|uniref:SAM-dependent methyltransferase n=1 Tax=Nocardioides sp. SYSU DS0651 TaxID=3415955 RepID=UPI003F4B53F4
MGTDNGSAPVSHEPDAHYDRVHETWRLIMGEEFHYGYFVPEGIPLERATAALTGQMLSRARIGAGDRVLDVGCGTGRQACDLAEQHGAEVLGITTSGTGVAAATRLADRRGLDGARFEQRDGTANGLPDGSFDVVWALESSHLMRDRRSLLSESARVLAPGGRLVLCDIIRRREIPFLEVRARREDFAVLRAAFGDAHMLPLDDYTTVLEELGLTVEDATDISDETLGTFAAWRANCAKHADQISALIGEDGLATFVRSTEVLEDFWNDGTLGYGILGAVKPPTA